MILIQELLRDLQCKLQAKSPQSHRGRRVLTPWQQCSLFSPYCVVFHQQVNWSDLFAGLLQAVRRATIDVGARYSVELA